MQPYSLKNVVVLEINIYNLVIIVTELTNIQWCRMVQDTHELHKHNALLDYNSSLELRTTCMLAISLASLAL